MKKAMLRKLRTISEKVLGEEKTNEIIENTVNKVIDKLSEETKPKKKKKSDK